MNIRRAILSVGYSVLGAGMGLGAASNMLDELPDGLIPVCISAVCVGLGIIVAGRLFPKEDEVKPSGQPPDQPVSSN